MSDADGDGRSAQVDGFSRLSTAQVASARFALDVTTRAAAGFSVEGFTNLRIDHAGLGSGAGDVRVANSNDIATSYAYLPGAGMGGDVWIGASGRAPRAGNYDHVTILHEIGHALGLKHSHEGWGLGTVAAACDSLEYTVMTYRPWAGGAATGYRFEKWGAPQTYMMLDIAALQAMYGADYSTNAGDTVYRWTPGSGRTLVNGAVAIDPGGDRIFATVWDGGGRDTYDLSAYKAAVTVDLRPGQHSVFSKGQLADLGGGPNGGHARGNVFNALLHHDDPRSLIEGAIGGSGNDRLIGNQAANVLRGGVGADRLDGLTGNDFLDGGSGNDRLFGGPGADKLYGRATTTCWSGDAARTCSPAVGADCFVFRSVGGVALRARGPGVASGGPAFDAPGRAFGDRIDVSAIDADAAARATRPSPSAARRGATCGWRRRGRRRWSMPTSTATRRRSSSSPSTTAPSGRGPTRRTTSSCRRSPGEPARRSPVAAPVGGADPPSGGDVTLAVSKGLFGPTRLGLRTALPIIRPQVSRNGGAPDFGRRRNPDASAPRGRTHSRVRGAATPGFRSPTGLPHPPSSPRSRAPTNGPAEAIPRLVGPRPRGLSGPLLTEVDGSGEFTPVPLPLLSHSAHTLTRARPPLSLPPMLLQPRHDLDEVAGPVAMSSGGEDAVPGVAAGPGRARQREKVGAPRHAGAGAALHRGGADLRMGDIVKSVPKAGIAFS